MNIIGNFSLAVPLAQHLQTQLSQLSNTAVRVRGFLADNPAQKRVVIETDMAGWDQVGKLINEYGQA